MERERHIPLEIIEQILLNLPARSLHRFSAVSKRWKSMISDEEFLRQHKLRASLHGHERILLCRSPMSLMPATTRRLSSLSSNHSDQPFISPIHDAEVVVSCSDMWCVVSRSSLYLLNPSMGTYEELPPPLSQIGCNFYYGMGFDSVADDYKILKVPKYLSRTRESELYSLRSNSWRKIGQFFPMQRSPYGSGVAVSNALHLMTKSPPTVNNGRTIISFDLSTEKYADDFVQPPFDYPMPKARDITVDLAVLRGNLCLYVNYYNNARRFVLWEMQEYGDGRSWTKIVDTDVSSMSFRHGRTIMKPLYLDQNGWMLMKATNSKSDAAKIFEVYEDEWRMIWKGCDCGYATGLVYAESLVSPAGNILQ